MVEREVGAATEEGLSILFSLHGEFAADGILGLNDILVEVFELEGLAGGGGHGGELIYVDGGRSQWVGIWLL